MAKSLADTNSSATLGNLARSPMPIVIGLLVAWIMQAWIGHVVPVFYAKIILDIGINIILAVSLNIVNGYTGQFSLGHGGFMAVGGYTAGIISYYGSYRLWGSPVTHGGLLGGGNLLFLAACIGGGCLAAAAGYVVGTPSLRLRGDYLAIVTLGFGEIIRVIIQRSNDVLNDAKTIQQTPWSQLATRVGGSLGFSGGSTRLPTYTNLFWVYLFVVLTLAVAYRLKYSSYGRAFLAIREDEKAAEALGVPVFKYKVRAFIIAAFFAGVAGALYAHADGTQLNPNNLGFMKAIDVVIMVVLGGMGSVSGTILAAIILTILPEALRSFESGRMIAYSLTLILMMILRPQGLCGIHEIWEFFGIGHQRTKQEPAS